MTVSLLAKSVVAGALFSTITVKVVPAASIAAKLLTRFGLPLFVAETEVVANR